MGNPQVMDHWLYRLLFRVRPAFVSSWIKKVLRIGRKPIETTSGVRLRIDPVSHFGREIIQTGTYEPELTAVFKAVLRPGDVFVDIGANEGYFSILSSRIVGSSGRVLAVEPQSRLQPVLKTNFAENQSTVELVPMALWDSVGQAALNLASDINTGSTSLLASKGRFKKQELVRTTTLDALLAHHGISKVRLLKIDAEGAEFPILRGAGELFTQRRVEVLSLDFHPYHVAKDVPHQMDRWLRDRGYELSQTGVGMWLYHLPEAVGAFASLGPSKPILRFG
jgi:FkbM family methyltransferase